MSATPTYITQAETLTDLVLELLEMAAAYGMNVAEARDTVPEHHHGSLSGTLSTLHKRGIIARLVEERNGCEVYVLPEHVLGRPTQKQGRDPKYPENIRKVLDLVEKYAEVPLTSRLTLAERNPQRFARLVMAAYRS